MVIVPGWLGHPVAVNAVAVLGANRIVSGSGNEAFGVWSVAPWRCY